MTEELREDVKKTMALVDALTRRMNNLEIQFFEMIVEKEMNKKDVDIEGNS